MNRLRPFIIKLVSHNQSSFIPMRDIANNIIVAQEVVHSLRSFRGAKKGTILKIDLEMTYVRIS